MRESRVFRVALCALLASLVLAGCKTVSVQEITPESAAASALIRITDPDLNPNDFINPSINGPIVPPVYQCASLQPISGAVCEYTPGSTPDTLLIRGNLLTINGVFEGGDLLVQNGQVTWMGCAQELPPGAAGAAVLNCPQGAVSPGLINAHDHIDYDQQPPRLPCAEQSGSYWECGTNPPGFNPETFRFSHRNQWRPKADNAPWLVGQTAPATASGSRFFVNYTKATTQAQIQWTELRQALAGTTSVVGSYVSEHEDWPQGMLRNLDVESLQEGLNAGKFEYVVFPQGDENGIFEPNCHYSGIVGPGVLDSTCFIPHVAEGVDYFAQTEVQCVANATGTSDEAIATYIHTVAGTAETAPFLWNQSISVVWAPRSNTSLYGNTAQVPMYDAQNLIIGLSTDWTPSGSINLLDEMACVNKWNSTYFNNYFSDYSIWMMSTFNASLITNVFPRIGLWATPSEADIAIFDAANVGQNYYRAVTTGRIEDVALVMRSGVPLTGDTQLLASMPNYTGNCESIGNICGVDKSACLQREWQTTWAALSQANAGSYMLFDSLCRNPEQYAPSCTPMRLQAPEGTSYTGIPNALDLDGDGIANTEDNCSVVFNPVRPMDVDPNTNSGSQLDCDRDGIGDACDATPMGGLTQCIAPYPPFPRSPQGT